MIAPSFVELAGEGLDLPGDAAPAQSELSTPLIERLIERGGVEAASKRFGHALIMAAPMAGAASTHPARRHVT